MQKIRAYCPLDCPDLCAYDVEVKDGKAEKISGAKDHPYTKGFLCGKADKILQRMYSPERILYPLRRKNETFKKISWEDAFSEIAYRLNEAKNKYGPTSVLYYSEEGSAGLLKALEKRFFNAFGGATFTEGSLCWGAVTGAQKKDFGEYRAHLWEDLGNSKTIVLWGRNIAATSVHMVPWVREAQRNGAHVIVIDPNRSQTAAFADEHIALRPGTDAVFALGVANIILQNRWADLDYVSKNAVNFADYLHIVKDYTVELVSDFTGIDPQIITSFARRYARSKPSCIWLGYGMQRYKDSGQTVRAINALGIITGNVGIRGGGVNHASQYTKKLIRDIDITTNQKTIRYFKKATLAEEIYQAKPPIEVMFVTSANPVTQLPNTNKVLDAINKIPFKIVSDFFLTDTAKLADIILPCASVFEKEDIVVSSWNPYICYNPKIQPPRGEAKADYTFFTELAQKMGLENFGYHKTPEEWLEMALEPAEQYGITLDKLKVNEIKNPLWEQVAWSDGKFATQSGKFEFLTTFSQPEKKDGIRLITVHNSKTMHSQYYNLIDDLPNYPYAFIPVSLADKYYLHDNDKIKIETQFGDLIVLVKVSEDIHPECLVIHEGSWISLGGGVNLLTGDYLSDIGNGTSYHEVFCSIRKIF